MICFSLFQFSYLFVHILMSSVFRLIFMSRFSACLDFDFSACLDFDFSAGLDFSVCFEFSAMSVKLSELMLRTVFATKAPDLLQRRMTGLWYRRTWYKREWNQYEVKVRETCTKLAKAGGPIQNYYFLWYTVARIYNDYQEGNQARTF